MYCPHTEVSALCSAHRLTSIPDVLYAVPSLEIILASDNQITEIRVDPLRKLARLATLDLRNNSIAHVPATLGYVSQLRWVPRLTADPLRVGVPWVPWRWRWRWRVRGRVVFVLSSLSFLG